MEILLLFLNQRKLLGEKYSQKPLTMNDYYKWMNSLWMKKECFRFR